MTHPFSHLPVVYEVHDLDGFYTATPDYMKAVAIAVERYRHWNMPDDTTAADMTIVWEVRNGERVAKYDWQRAYRQLCNWG